MKNLRTFAHRSEALVAQTVLASHGIEGQILGGERGKTSLLVPDGDLRHAQTIVNKILAKDMLLTKDQSEPKYFRKAVLFAIGAPLLVPIVFNYKSLQNAYYFWEESEQQTADILKVLFIIALNIPTYFILKYAFSMFGEVTSMMGELPGEGADF